MGHVPRFDPTALTAAANDTFTVRRVFGEAYERDGVLVVPVARVWAATGLGLGDGEGGGTLPERGNHAAPWARRARAAWERAGHGSDDVGDGGHAEDAADTSSGDGVSAEGDDLDARRPADAHGPQSGYGGGHGGGGGYGARVKAVGVYVVDDRGVHWRPAVDVNRVIVGGQAVAATALVSLAAVLTARAAADAVSRAVAAFARR